MTSPAEPPNRPPEAEGAALGAGPEPTAAPPPASAAGPAADPSPAVAVAEPLEDPFGPVAPAQPPVRSAGTAWVAPVAALRDEAPGTVGLSAELVSAGALALVPPVQARWVAVSVAVATILGAGSVWDREPEAALALTIGAGAAMVDLRRLWAIPLTVAVTGLAGLAAGALDVPAVLGAGLVAGAIAAFTFPLRMDWLDTVHGALGTMAGASIGLWAATQLVPDTLPTVLHAALTAGLTALVASQGLLPMALRFDATPQVPTMRDIAKTLKLPYRPPVFRALDLHGSASRNAPDRDTRRGLAEVATWVFKLQATIQTLDHELQQIDPQHVNARITQYRSEPADADPFTRERRTATIGHLERLLQHRALLETERRRTDSLVDYALAFLEEARAGLAIAQRLPGELSPDRLPEVLHRLRAHAAEGDARRRTARELQPL